jgi:hypothetical protein
MCLFHYVCLFIGKLKRRSAYPNCIIYCVCSKSETFDKLYELPEHLKVKTSTKRSEDMLSNSMLSGIPEIDLGIE